MFNLLLTETAEQNPKDSWWIYLVLIGLIIVMLVIPSISNRKRSKEYNEMINNISVGDTVRTVGGVIGRIVKINEKDGYKTIILETGAKNSKTTMEFDMASIYVVLNSKNKPAEKKEEPAVEAKAEEKKEETVAEQPKTEEPVAEVKTEEKKEEPVKKTAKKTSKKQQNKF